MLIIHDRLGNSFYIKYNLVEVKACRKKLKTMCPVNLFTWVSCMPYASWNEFALSSFFVFESF